MSVDGAQTYVGPTELAARSTVDGAQTYVEPTELVVNTTETRATLEELAIKVASRGTAGTDHHVHLKNAAEVVIDMHVGHSDKFDRDVSEEAIANLRKFFDRLDCDASGGFAEDELEEFFDILGFKLERRDVARILKKMDRSETGEVSFKDLYDFLYHTHSDIRLMEPWGNASYVDTRASICAALLGSGSRLEEWIFWNTMRQNKKSGKLLWLMWYIGLIMGMLANFSPLCPWSPARLILVFFSILMVPLPIFCILVLCLDLIHALIFQPETWIILGLSCAWCWHAVRLVGDARCIFYFCLMPSMFVSALSDAYPSKFRPHFQKMFYIGLPIPMIFYVTTVLFELNLPVYHHEWSFLILTGSSTTNSVVNVGTLLCFAVRNLISAFWSPDTFVIIVSPTRTVQFHMKDVISGAFQEHSTLQAKMHAFVGSGADGQQLAKMQKKHMRKSSRKKQRQDRFLELNLAITANACRQFASVGGDDFVARGLHGLAVMLQDIFNDETTDEEMCADMRKRSAEFVKSTRDKMISMAIATE